MESKFDWFTLTIKPENKETTFDECFAVLSDTMLLGDLFSKMVPRGRFLFYDYVLTYENISLCYTDSDRFLEQGICLRISSQGLDYLTRYLKTYNIDLKQWLGKWRGLVFDGYMTKETRLDYAMDDIRFNGEEPVLTLKKVIDCNKRKEICKKARSVNIWDCDGVTVQERYKTVCKEPIVGRTLNLGSRQSEVFCRFYDKLAEQLHKKEAVPQDCTSWTRCEFEFKGSKAMSVLNAFLDMSDEDFGKYMRGVCNNYVSFIVRNNKNISRCSVKRWWAKFLGGCTEKFKLPHKEPSRSAFAKACHGLSKYVPTVYTMFQKMGLEGVYRFFEREVEVKKMSNPDLNVADRLYKKELAQNIEDGVRDYEEMTGLKYYKYNSFDGEEGWDIEDNIHRQNLAYFYLLYEAKHLSPYDKQRHQDFMDGCEVLYDGM